MRILYTIIIGLALVACQTPRKENKIIRGNAFGTTYSVIYHGNVSENVLVEEIDSVIEVFNKSVSTYDPESLISKFNAGDTTIVVDDIFKEVFFMSQEVYKNSNGYFDPTVGALRNAYGFGDVDGLESINQNDLDSIMEMVGFDKLHFNSNNTISKQHPKIYLDFNAIAKGYGVDRVAAVLEEHNLSNYLVEIGGELFAKGINVDKDVPWTVGIEGIQSDLENRSYTHTLKLENAGMAASGNYRKYREDPVTGKQYVHTINPITGSAERTDVTSATVVAQNCALADAYATTFMALGIEKSKALLEKLDKVDAYLTYFDSEGEESSYATPGMKLRMLD